MADLLIGDLAMPKDRNTTLIIYCDGTINLRVQMEDGEHLIPITAKAVPLPEGHGRLIDADELENCARPNMRGVAGYSSDIRDWSVLVSEIRSAQTVVPTEGGGEDG